MRKILVAWMFILAISTGISLVATMNNWMIGYAKGEHVSLREQSIHGGHARYFFVHRHSRSPLGGGLGYGK